MAKYRPHDRAMSFKEATKNMVFKDKFKYFFEYYKGWVLATVVVIGFVSYMVNHALTSRPTFINIQVTSGFVNLGQQLGVLELEDEDDEVPFEESLTPAYGFFLDDEALRAKLSEYLLTDETRDDYFFTVSNLPINFETIQVFNTHLGAGELDIIISYVHELEAMTDTYALRPLDSVDVAIPSHMKVDDFIIDITNHPFFADVLTAHNPDLPIGLGIAIGTRRVEAVTHFLDVLNND